MNKLMLVTLMALSTLALSGAQVVLYNNGPFVTHPGGGAGGADASMASVNPNWGGLQMYNANSPGKPEQYTIADDFTVTDSQGWYITRITMYGYEIDANNPNWTLAKLKIYNGVPGGGGSVIASYTSTNWSSTGVFRVFNGVANLPSTLRLINRIVFDIPSLELAQGSYWVALQVDTQLVGGNPRQAWANFVMDINPNDPNNPITRVGNARQFTENGWGAAIPPNTGVNVEFPFIVEGNIVPEPASFLTLMTGLAGALSLHRRRRV